MIPSSAFSWLTPRGAPTAPPKLHRAALAAADGGLSLALRPQPTLVFPPHSGQASKRCVTGASPRMASTRRPSVSEDNIMTHTEGWARVQELRQS